MRILSVKFKRYALGMVSEIEGRTEMKKVMAIVVSAAILVLACGHSFADAEKEVRKEFDGVKAVRLSTVSGDCIVETHGSDEVIVDLAYDADLEDVFDYKIDKRGGKLMIKERWRGHSSGGMVLWTLTVPEGTEIGFSTASGDLAATGPIGSIEARTASGDVEIEDVDGDIEISTASGDINIIDARGEKEISTASGDISVEKSAGDIEFSTASGDVEADGIEGEIEIHTASGEIEISDSKGIFELSCASGEISAEGISVEGASDFSTASGSIEVILAKATEYDMELSAASGDVTLDYNGNEVVGYFEFEARKSRGRIKCPFDFENEEEFEKNDRIYVRKSFSRKGDTPEIRLSTASGRVVLKK